MPCDVRPSDHVATCWQSYTFTLFTLQASCDRGESRSRRGPRRSSLRELHGQLEMARRSSCTLSEHAPKVLFYTWTGFAYSRNADEIVSKASREYWTSLKASWVIFTPFNFANFYIVPVRHQVTTNVAVSFVWNLTLSCLAAPRASDMKLGDGSGVSRSTHSSLLIASARES